MKFDYLTVSGALDSKGRLVKRPILPLEITTSDGQTLGAFGLLDSGADTTTLNIEYAEALGVTLGNKREIMGVGNGKTTVFEGSFTFTIKHMGKKITVPAWYVDSNNVNILIGQEGFFEQFKIKFEKDYNIFELINAK